jgi:Protein of unknown function (DUF3644)
MSLKYPEIQNDYFLQIKNGKLLNEKHICLLAFIIDQQPTTINNVLSKISALNTSLSPLEVSAFNKLTNPLKAKGIVEVVEIVKQEGKRKAEEVIRFTDSLPIKPAKKISKKTEFLIDSALTTALNAVEIYNKPRSMYRTENFITLMCIAWTRLLQAHILNTSGDIFYEKDRTTGDIIYIEEDKKTWSLEKCVNEAMQDGPPKENLKILIKLRNKFVHSIIADSDLDSVLYGECQANLHNFELFLQNSFGKDFVISHNIDFSLQFSKRLTSDQWKAHKSRLSDDAKSLLSFLDKYKSTLTKEIIDSPSFSFKAVLIPVIKNSGRDHDISIEVLKDPIRVEDLKKITIVEKEKVVEVANANKIRPGDVVKAVSERTGTNFNMHHHTELSYMLDIRRRGSPNKTNPKYCIYDKPFKSHLYTPKWVDLIVKGIKSQQIDLQKFVQMKSKKQSLNLENLERGEI